MGRPRRSSNRKKARTDAGAGPSGDRISALPLELRARIASYLHFREVVQLSALSRPWRYIHHHTPTVKVYLHHFVSHMGHLDEASIVALRAALARRAQDAAASSSTVETLRLAYVADDPRMRRHAARILALADARDVRVYSPYRDDGHAASWALDLTAAARDLEVTAPAHLAPAIAGPGAAALRRLSLSKVVLGGGGGWPPSLPSLRSLNLDQVKVEAPFAPDEWCPLLEELDMFCCKIEHARVDIRLPRLRFLDLDDVDVTPHGELDGPPFGEVTIDAPELKKLDVACCAAGSARDYKSFTLRAPRLRWLCWRNQFAERVRIDVGRPGSVKVGRIQLRTIYYRETEHYKKLMMRMLEGLLPDLTPEGVADVARSAVKRSSANSVPISVSFPRSI